MEVGRQIAKRIAGYAELDDHSLCYYKAEDIWWLYLPGCGLGNLKNHTVEEHEDGTISVTPSILVTGHREGQKTTVHGYLTRGEWRDA